MQPTNAEAKGSTLNDIIYGKGGNDVIFADLGADTVYGGSGDGNRGEHTGATKFPFTFG